ncbi:GPP34 family phosphoprotein [Streptomyces cellostaticus]|uniref:GPP34 family phosphoprotein n=1 Tax=Streptomyces cellostaticus TaxID=67285 RepID=UPI002026AAC8|nr:GPP34 family phosphoprotein [Streptomyces cellostaticus]
MTTARDLFIVGTDIPGDHPVEQGDLSLALAGAELVDLIGARAVTLEGERMVPGPPLALGDRMLDEADSALVRREPYETVEDWLWRRGEGLAAAYFDALDAEGQLTGERRPWFPRRPRTAAAGDTAARRHATDRWESREPVLATLAAALGIGDGQGDGAGEEFTDEPVVTVLAAVGDAVTELTAVRQRREIENAAFDNIWRAP